MANRTDSECVIRQWSSDDCEPEDAVRVLIEVSRGRRPLYLARFKHGWLWVRDQFDLRRACRTPLAWRWAVGADAGVITRVRELTEREQREWQGSLPRQAAPRTYMLVD